MYSDTLEYANNCAIVQGTGRQQKPLFIGERPFQIVGVDIMKLPVISRGNRYVVVFQDLLTKWPMVFPTLNQKAVQIAQLLVEQVVPIFGVPEALISDRGMNLLSSLMKNICKMLEIEKLNTTVSHP